jgi:hypothetical protein
MTGRKGEITRGDLKRKWPRHVALPAEKGRGLKNSEVIFCAAGVYRQRRSLNSLRRDNRDFVVFCFSEPEHAEAFAQLVRAGSCRLLPSTSAGGGRCPRRGDEVAWHKARGLLAQRTDLIADASGALSGTTTCGGTGYGTVFKLTPPATTGRRWTDAVLYSFTGGANGAYSPAGLSADASGAPYGTTESGGNLCSSFVQKARARLRPPSFTHLSSSSCNSRSTGSSIGRYHSHSNPRNQGQTHARNHGPRTGHH